MTAATAGSAPFVLSLVSKALLSGIALGVVFGAAQAQIIFSRPPSTMAPG